MKRQAQASGGAAATLVGIITLLIIFYLLFIPTEMRKELLKEEGVPDEDGKMPPEREVLLQESPGRLSAVGQTEFVHEIPNMVLIEEKEAQVLAEFNPFTIKKGWFRKQFRNLSFALADPANTEGVQLSFQVPVNKGKLRIWLNGNLVFEGDINVNNPLPVKLPDALLKTINNLEFQVWGLGLTAREYRFEDVKLIGDITAAEKQKAIHAFSVTRLEFENIESGYLGFYAICSQADVGVLDISLNGRTLYSAVPACNSPNRHDLFAEDFRDGKNTIEFSLRQGSARIEQARIKNLVKPTKGWGEFFFIDSETDRELAAGADAVIEIEFVDDSRLKEAQLNINGRLDIVSQRAPMYVREITGIVRPGNNYIEILPLTDLSIADIEVRVE